MEILCVGKESHRLEEASADTLHLSSSQEREIRETAKFNMALRTVFKPSVHAVDGCIAPHNIWG